MTWQFRNLFKREKEGENILTKKIIINTCIYARSYNHIWNTHRILRMLISLSLFFFFFFSLHHGVCGKLKVKVKVSRSCQTLCDPMDYTVHGILQARTLEWVAFPFLQGIFPTQGSNPSFPHCRGILYQLSHNLTNQRWKPHPLQWKCMS